MVFHSSTFVLLFLPAVVAGYHLARRFTGRTVSLAWLAAASLAFYSWDNPRNLAVLLFSIGANYAVGRRLAAQAQPAGRRGRALLVAGLAVNLLLLGAFKYTNFLLANLASVLGTDLAPVRWLLPLGISFYTLQQVTYLVDCYEGLVKGHGALEHLAFVSFFPYVSMGPITRSRQILPQWSKPAAPIDCEAIWRGVALFVLGLVQKVLIADSFSQLAGLGFDHGGRLSALEAWLSALAYTLQIYYDFSGYSDMAIGIGLMLNLQLPVNFNHPYGARSIVEFWQRWHITLSQLITTYIYTPLIRSFGKVTFAKAMVATFLAMLIAGLWHGPAWTFVLFGALHGAGLVVNQVWKRTKRKLPGGLAWLLTFLYVALAFAVFRSPDIARAWEMIKSLLALHSVADLGAFQQVVQERFPGVRNRVVLIATPLVGLSVALFLRVLSRGHWLVAGPGSDGSRALGWREGLVVGGLAFVALRLLYSAAPSPFLYFQF